MERTQLRRKPQRGSHDRAVIDAIVDEALVCHVGYLAPHGPIVIPMAHVRIGDRIYVHGAATNAALAGLASGGPACVTITLLDGLVLAQSALHHSMNYRSVVVFGAGARVDDPDERRRALAALVDKPTPGRSAACRPPSAAELAATLVVGFPLTEASAKIRSGPPLAPSAEDAALPYWAGVIPLSIARGEPIPALPDA